MWSQLHHPNILPLLGIVPYALTGMDSFVVPWMVGGSCVDYLRMQPDADRLSMVSALL